MTAVQKSQDNLAEKKNNFLPFYIILIGQKTKNNSQCDHLPFPQPA